MSTQSQARALMMRHSQVIRNRQESMLGRAAAEIGMDIDAIQYRTHTQGKSNFRKNYDRSNATMS
ncbi:hypothetical protein IQ249_21770 [Lusitaniella coriacea LEGE 07157]|uniref:Glutamine synthetase inactivating factor IF7 n=1 Tax=Lusitaniella coriacea LEGE 07157 TaxID=945747 RepID=A0A8J7DZI6_9CYAN|nr:hypothetical protein [Lusitaniella coriacea]MBE9118522.1 hypothetical protein [Lusitaniella coriacea LEGE 07157]